jgi:hypothetical protein
MTLHAPLILDIAGTALTDVDRRRLAHPLVGGMILFGRNWQSRAQLTDLCADIKSIRADLLIAVDHEGGRVQRFRTDGFTHLPPMRALGELWHQDDQGQPGSGVLKACEAALPADAAIFAAAVADWRVKNAAGEKLKKQVWADGLKLDFTENPDILKTISARTKSRPALCVGFAAETVNVIENAKAKLAAKACDLIVANDVSATSGVFGGAQNTVSLVTRKGVEAWPRMDKGEVARKLIARMAEMLG